MTWEEQKQKRRAENKRLKEYLKGRPPSIVSGIATFSDGKRYVINHSGWRRLKSANV